MSQARAVLLVATAAVLWASVGIWSTELLDAGVSAVEIACWRALGGGACFVVHAAVAGRLRPGSLAEVGRLALFAVVGVSVFYVALPEAIDRGGMGLAFVLLYTAPAFVVVAAALFLGERIQRRTVALVAITMVGVALVVLPGGDASVAPDAVAWGLLAGLTYSTYYIAVKRFGRRLPAFTVYAWALPIGGLLLVPLVDPAPKGAREYVLLFLACTVSTYLPYLLHGLALLRMDAGRTAVVATLEPVVALALGIVVYDETLLPLAALGSLLVLGAAAASARPAPRARTMSPS